MRRVGAGGALFWEVGIDGTFAPQPGLPEVTQPGTEPFLELLGTWPAGSAASTLRAAAPVWLEMADEALTSIDLETFSLPASAEPLVFALERAAARGVHVRVLADDASGSESALLLTRLSTRTLIEVRRLDGGLLAGGRLAAAQLIVDTGDAAFAPALPDSAELAGCRTTGRVASGTCRLGEDAASLGLRLLAPGSVRALEDLFESDWARAGRAPPVREQEPPLGGYQFPESAVAVQRLSPNAAAADLEVTPLFGPATALPDPALSHASRLLELIESSRHTLRLALPDLNPLGAAAAPLAEALARAATRGVEVQILLTNPSEENEPLRRLLQTGLHLERASAGTASFLVIDSRSAWVGTGGFTDRSLLRDRTIGLAIEGPSVAQTLEGLFARAWRTGTTLARRA